MIPVSLKNVTISTIKPYAKTEHPATVEASFLDLFVMDIYIPIVFFYKPEEGLPTDAFVNLVEKLKESLSKVLVPYFPMAGRWLKTYDARIRELVCNDEGVTFIEAFIDEKLESVVRLNDFETMELLVGHQFMGLDPKAFQQDVETLPSFFVQVTQFKCGSVALNATFSHTTTDGKGMFAFMQAWSEIALHGQTSIVPTHDRSLTTSLAEFMRSQCADDAGDEDVVKPENVSTKEMDTETKRVDPGLALHFPWTAMTNNKIIYVRRQVIEDLKQEAEMQNIEVTTLDLITAHLWRSVNRFPESMDGKTLSVVGTMVEGRTRFHDPHLSEHYSGNVAFSCLVPQVPALDLAAGKSPLFAANIVHNTVRDINASNWQSYLSCLMAELKDLPNLKYRILTVSSWFRFPMYEISFGHGFGKPVFACENFAMELVPLGAAIVQPPPPSLADDAIASVQLHITRCDALKTLFSDEQFLSFFLPFH